MWRQLIIELKKYNLNVIVKHSNENVILWKCFSTSGVRNLKCTEGTMNTSMYIDILKKNLMPSAEKLDLQKNFSFSKIIIRSIEPI